MNKKIFLFLISHLTGFPREYMTSQKVQEELCVIGGRFYERNCFITGP